MEEGAGGLEGATPGVVPSATLRPERTLVGFVAFSWAVLCLWFLTGGLPTNWRLLVLDVPASVGWAVSYRWLRRSRSVRACARRWALSLFGSIALLLLLTFWFFMPFAPWALVHVPFILALLLAGPVLAVVAVVRLRRSPADSGIALVFVGLLLLVTFSDKWLIQGPGVRLRVRLASMDAEGRRLLAHPPDHEAASGVHEVEVATGRPRAVLWVWSVGLRYGGSGLVYAPDETPPSRASDADWNFGYFHTTGCDQVGDHLYFCGLG